MKIRRSHEIAVLSLALSLLAVLCILPSGCVQSTRYAGPPSKMCLGAIPIVSSVLSNSRFIWRHSTFDVTLSQSLVLAMVDEAR
ncbi:MAG TPA: hypothetical protein VIK22_03320 [Candidatus Anoxymicrobiaceae bacterium]